MIKKNTYQMNNRKCKKMSQTARKRKAEEKQKQMVTKKLKPPCSSRGTDEYRNVCVLKLDYNLTVID